MRPSEFLTLPHTAEEALDLARIYEPAKADRIRRTHLPVEITGPAQETIDAAQAQLTRFARWAAVEILELVACWADDLASLSHPSCRRTAVIAPRWRKRRDRVALDRLLDRLCEAQSTGSANTGTTIGDTDQGESTDAEPESPPDLLDRYEPAALRGPPCQRMSSRLGRGLGLQELGTSDSITQHSSRSVNWDLMKGGERT